ncbi:hypothetical protein L211DRAFT_661506 [Terfezia boudieri ATCC MYA-4762]|uniref:Uncharacterized protein n=1 Tax=Terfezia boudieri ATCC MYA-4762 TaxID=1051890 RepID=A0A3N4M1T7_9PEZI|nr:hypothetical protein L211DRAFT_661506 [Terfezia boudieri ATCC MYA-4762]
MTSPVELFFASRMNTNFLSVTLTLSITTNSSSIPVTLSTDTISFSRHNRTLRPVLRLKSVTIGKTWKLIFPLPLYSLLVV